MTTKKETPTIQSYTELGFAKVPIAILFKLKILSRPTLYQHVREGKYNLYKMNGRSYVDVREFNEAFTKVEIADLKGTITRRRGDRSSPLKSVF